VEAMSLKRSIKFTKMQGAGNDYVYVDCFKEQPDVDFAELAKKVSDRHFGIGSDGLILIMPSEKADFRMRMFNADGSEAEMCGNGVRCVGKYVYDRGLTKKTNISLETLGGIKILELIVSEGEVKSVKVDMGEPILEPAKVPVASSNSRFISQPVRIDEDYYILTCVSMGNPHAISYVDNVKNVEIEKIGPMIENFEMFPARTNVEFIHVIDRNTLKMRVWERGAGETLACGTGACASLVASVLNDVSDRKAVLKLLGGDLQIEWSEKDNHVYMTGPAEIVFDGEYYY
jgi:diaminopimelate epimerase